MSQMYYVKRFFKPVTGRKTEEEPSFVEETKLRV